MSKDLSQRLDLLQTFVRIVEAGSLSAAAKQLGTTQPTASRRLQALERSLGMRLLQRSTHAMKLTEDGQRCYERARDLLARWENFGEELRGPASESAGHLRVRAPHAFGQELLLAPVVDFLKRHPRVTVEWLLDDRTPNFIAEDIDCAIQVGETSDPSLVSIRLWSVPRILVAAPQLLAGRPLPQHPGELVDLPWMALQTFYRTEIELTPVAGGESVLLPIRPRLSTDSLFALRNAALMGLGVCAASAWALADDVAQGRLIHLAPLWQTAPLPVNLIYPPTRFPPLRLSQFIALMRQVAPEAMEAVGRNAGNAQSGRVR
ncbi:LysR family transcriptional regulator [Variovorax dokdonensis]|uniref:LysR family transcriptional regulator n=1 Tax=Variovorax dokdonensis TaxID=344883 RepID=A0ABT7NEX8_9BURK|nr:LysR family transcriptional regulator [Variovorax dokdonensis]MDM0046494.1 LysR family transcriptional regulator [Variovorax dokdonensis]